MDWLVCEKKQCSIPNSDTVDKAVRVFRPVHDRPTFFFVGALQNVFCQTNNCINNTATVNKMRYVAYWESVTCPIFTQISNPRKFQKRHELRGHKTVISSTNCLVLEQWMIFYYLKNLTKVATRYTVCNIKFCIIEAMGTTKLLKNPRQDQTYYMPTFGIYLKTGTCDISIRFIFL